VSKELDLSFLLIYFMNTATKKTQLPRPQIT